MIDFNKWLNSLPNKTAIVKLPEDKEIEIDIPKELQVEHISEDTMPCNKCPKGYTEMWVHTKELNFTLRDGDTFMSGMMDNFTEEELQGLSRLVEQGIIVERVYT